MIGSLIGCVDIVEKIAHPLNPQKHGEGVTAARSCKENIFFCEAPQKSWRDASLRHKYIYQLMVVTMRDKLGSVGETRQLGNSAVEETVTITAPQLLSSTHDLSD